jgi:hypothetical protein
MPRNKGPPLRARSMGCGARASPARSVAAGIPVPLPIRWISALPCPCLPTEQSTAWSAADRELAHAVCSVHRTGCNATPCTMHRHYDIAAINNAPCSAQHATSDMWCAGIGLARRAAQQERAC